MCTLRKAGEPLSEEELVTNLRASDLIVRRSVAELTAAGLVSLGEEGRAAYAPATPELAALAGAAEERYARSPDAVRRIIVSAVSPGLTAFADAFRLKDKP